MLGFAFSAGNAHAIVDPLSVPNNKFGVHILFTSELEKARKLLNSSLGDWGYVTIPIQAGDKDPEKWQKFMTEAGEKHIIPIIRIATENHYFNTSVWRKPDGADILDFANFLNSLEWPVKNRYVIIFNEVNRGDEWEGSPNPAEYARILSYATEVFKSLSPDFFIISAGLDNASANSSTAMNQYNFMSLMNEEVPGIFNQIDGLGSHSYPNPAFSQVPWSTSDMGISSFKFEKELAQSLSGKNLPIFITETGWSRDKLPDSLIASHFAYAFESVWLDKDVVAVTPFLLQAGTVPFSQFSLLTEGGDYNEISDMLYKITKVQGKPIVNEIPSAVLSPNSSYVPYKTFSQKPQFESKAAERAKAITPFLKWILRVSD